MKKIILSAILLATTSFYAQDGKVGVGNTDPKATLDVTGTPATATTADGIIAPRLTGDQLAAKDAVYIADQTAAQVYVTAAATTPAGKTVNVTAPGYYYYDGAVWQKVASGGTKFVDGTIATDAVYTTGNVGVGTNLPATKLDVLSNLISSNSNSIGIRNNVIVDATSGNVTNRGFSGFDSQIVVDATNTYNLSRIRVLNTSFTYNGTGNADRLEMLRSQLNLIGTPNVNIVRGALFIINNNAHTGNISTVDGVRNEISSGQGSVISIRSFSSLISLTSSSGNVGNIIMNTVENNSSTAYAGSITNYFDFKAVSNSNIAARITNNYGIYIEGAEKTNYFQGKLGIGTITPGSKLSVVGLPIHVDNAAALTAGLLAGDFYHAGDGIVRVVF